MRQGDLGGFVQSQDNLSQEESCWIFHNAIVAEEAVVAGNAQIHDTAVIRGNALVSGSAVIRNHSLVEDHAIITAGVVEAESRISGEAWITESQWTKEAPRICNSLVYGKLSGNVRLYSGAQVLPGQAFHNPTPDELRITETSMKMLRNPEREGLRLAPPEGWKPAKKKTRSEPER